MTLQVESDPEAYVGSLCRRSREASRSLVSLRSEVKSAALRQIAQNLNHKRSELKAANEIDLEEGKRRGLSGALQDRLELTNARIDEIVSGLERIAAMRDPVGEVVGQWRRPGGFEVGQIRIPLGVIAVIYESRPNVTADAAALCFKAGNATILRGGSEALHSNQEIGKAIRAGLAEEGVNPDAIQVIDRSDREIVGALLRQHHLVDLVIPRGGKGLIQRVVQESTVPVIKHYEGICHTYVHQDADLEMALEIAVNAKVQRPATCNAMETLLVDSAIAPAFLPLLSERFRQLGVTMYGCEKTAAIVGVDGMASEESYRTEYLGPSCNLRIVEDIDEALNHIATYGSRHTDAIVTASYEVSRRFITEVDSSSVMVNASSRLADGAVYGLGAEIGISTDKLHAFGPMGVNELTSKKFVVYGNGSLRE